MLLNSRDMSLLDHTSLVNKSDSLLTTTKTWFNPKSFTICYVPFGNLRIIIAQRNEWPLWPFHHPKWACLDLKDDGSTN